MSLAVVLLHDNAVPTTMLSQLNTQLCLTRRPECTPTVTWRMDVKSGFWGDRVVPNDLRRVGHQINVRVAVLVNLQP